MDGDSLNGEVSRMELYRVISGSKIYGHNLYLFQRLWYYFMVAGKSKQWNANLAR